MKTFAMVCFAVCAFFTGCTTITPGTVELARAPLPEGLGRLIVYRKPQFAGSGVFPKLFVDKSDRGALTNASVIAIDVTPGDHVLAAKGSLLTYGFSDVTRILKVEAGKIYYVEYAVVLAEAGFTSSVWQYGFRDVDPAVGRIEVDDLLDRVAPRR